MLQDLDTDLSRMFGHLFFQTTVSCPDRQARPSLKDHICAFIAMSRYFMLFCQQQNTTRPQDTDLSQDYDINEVIEMALSDHTSFDDIKQLYGLSSDDVKLIMRQNLKRGSYEAWRRRVRKFSDRREHYK